MCVANIVRRLAKAEHDPAESTTISIDLDQTNLIFPRQISF